MPAGIGLLHIQLDERPRQLLAFPRCRRLAGAEADDRIVHADRLTGLHADIAGDAIALVEEAEHRDPLGHRGHADLLAGAGVRTGELDPIAIFAIPPALAGGRHQQPEDCAGRKEALHAQSGVQAW